MTENRLNPSPIHDYLNRALAALRPETEAHFEKLVAALVGFADDHKIAVTACGGGLLSALSNQGGSSWV
jgi:hypothetical protein